MTVTFHKNHYASAERATGLTQNRLREMLSYDPETGLFRWKVNVNRRARIGDIAGSINPFGYVRISLTVDGARKRFMAHRLAWFYVHGDWPSEFLDHIDGERAHNAIGNLREANRAENAFNRSCRRSLPKGVHYRKRCPNGVKNYVATVSADGRQRHIGYFATPEEAKAARDAIARDAHGPFFRA